MSLLKIVMFYCKRWDLDTRNTVPDVTGILCSRMIESSPTKETNYWEEIRVEKEEKGV